MNLDAENVSIEFSFWTPLVPWDEVDLYGVKINGTISRAIYSEDEDAEVDWQEIGRMKLLVVKLAEAEFSDVDPFSAMDCHQVEWLHGRLLKKGGGYLSRPQITAPYGDLLVIEEVEFERGFDDHVLRTQAIETAIASFASIGVVVVRQRTLKLGKPQWTELGYKYLPFQDFLYRDNSQFHGW